MIAQTVQDELAAFGSPERAAGSARFFKTGAGQYGEGDIFIGVTVPEIRRVAKRHAALPLADLEDLLHSPVHEHRLTALLILVAQYARGDAAARERIYHLYLRNTDRVNNWDLVDSSAEHIVGPWLQDRPDKMAVLRRLAASESLWERRIAMLATFAYIKQGRAEEALQVADLLLADTHDLIHKAVGWMLREIGKRCGEATEEAFLLPRYRTMPRTMLRYAIERFPEDRRRAYLRGDL